MKVTSALVILLLVLSVFAVAQAQLITTFPSANQRSGGVANDQIGNLQLQQQIASLETQIRTLKAENERLAQENANLRAELDKARPAAAKRSEYLRGNLAVGQTGLIEAPITVKVLSKTEAIVSFVSVEREAHPSGATSAPTERTEVVLRGMNTTGMVENAPTPITRAVRVVVSSRRIGDKTYFVVVPSALTAREHSSGV